MNKNISKLICPICKNSFELEDTFCGYCGAKLNEIGQESTPSKTKTILSGAVVPSKINNGSDFTSEECRIDTDSTEKSQDKTEDLVKDVHRIDNGFICPYCDRMLGKGLYKNCPGCSSEFDVPILISTTDKNPDTQDFCSNCGEIVELFFRFCSNCGYEVNIGSNITNTDSEDWRLCEKCNSRVSADDEICQHCKAELEEIYSCPDCNSFVKECDKYCHYCGVEFE